MGTIKSSEHKAEMKFVGSLDKETNVNVTIIVAVDDSPFIDKLKYSYKEKNDRNRYASMLKLKDNIVQAESIAITNIIENISVFTN